MDKAKQKKRKRKYTSKKKKPTAWTAGASLLAALLVVAGVLLYKHYTQMAQEPEEVFVELPDSRKIEGPVVLAWHQDYTGTFGDHQKELLAPTQGIVNVLSPTWFKFTDSGALKSCANSDYLVWAHSKGYQVWALVDNDFADDKTYAVLKDEGKRTKLIDELLTACESLELDGINVDFEGLSSETAPYFIEFVRELCAVLRPAGYCVSVDVSVPEAWSSYYRRDLLGKYCDYVIVMGYDEHYRGGGETGSVSSLPWATQAVITMLEQVPKEKLILGVPFYTQLWASKGGEIKNEALSMEEAASWIEENQASVSYDEESGQHYASVTREGTLFEVWLEDAMSMEKRLQLAKENELRGVACWKLGMDSAEIWETMEGYR